MPVGQLTLPTHQHRHHHDTTTNTTITTTHNTFLCMRRGVLHATGDDTPAAAAASHIDTTQARRLLSGPASDWACPGPSDPSVSLAPRGYSGSVTIAASDLPPGGRWRVFCSLSVHCILGQRLAVVAGGPRPGGGGRQPSAASLRWSVPAVGDAYDDVTLYNGDTLTLTWSGALHDVRAVEDGGEGAPPPAAATPPVLRAWSLRRWHRLAVPP
eukprot:365856-Chlamydomonas_euryale.AAC.10